MTTDRVEEGSVSSGLRIDSPFVVTTYAITIGVMVVIYTDSD